MRTSLRQPRTVTSLHTSLLPFPPVTFPCRHTFAPHEMASQSALSSFLAPPLATLTISCKCLGFFFRLASWSPGRLSSSILSVSSVYFSVMFFIFSALNHSSGNCCVLEQNVCTFKAWIEKERFESLLFHVTNRQECCQSYFLFFRPVITKISTGLNTSSLAEWKWNSVGERKTGPLARLHGLSLMLLTWHRDSPWLGHLFRHTLSHQALGRWETIAFSLHGAVMPWQQKTSIL